MVFSSTKTSRFHRWLLGRGFVKTWNKRLKLSVVKSGWECFVCGSDSGTRQKEYKKATKEQTRMMRQGERNPKRLMMIPLNAWPRKPPLKIAN